LRNVDYRHDCFDLSVRLGDLQLDRKRVKRYEPVWINIGGNSTKVRLIADRVSKNVVHGYLSRPQSKVSATGAQRIKNAGTAARELRTQNGG
jgi:hypothetical protein